MNNFHVFHYFDAWRIIGPRAFDVTHLILFPLLQMSASCRGPKRDDSIFNYIFDAFMWDFLIVQKKSTTIVRNFHY